MRTDSASGYIDPLRCICAIWRTVGEKGRESPQIKLEEPAGHNSGVDSCDVPAIPAELTATATVPRTGERIGPARLTWLGLLLGQAA